MRMSIAEWSDIESEQMNCPVVKMKRVMMRTSLPGVEQGFVGWREAAGLYIGEKHRKNPFIILAYTNYNYI